LVNSFQKDFPDATARIVEDPPGPPVLSTFLLKVKGDDDATRERIAADVAQLAHATKGVVDLDTTLPERSPALTYQIDTVKAEALGVSALTAAETLRIALSGSDIGLSHISDRKEQQLITMRFATEDRGREHDLAFIKVPNRHGDLVALGEFAHPTNQAVNQVIATDDRQKTSSVSAEMGNRGVIYAVFDLFPQLLHYQLPNSHGTSVSWSPFGITYEDLVTHEHYAIEIGGEWKLTLEVFRDLGIVMGLVIFLIFFVLVARTQSLLIPALIMVSIPLGLIGILPGFAFLHALKGTYFNATSMIGVIALSGLSVKNAIIYLEYLEPLKRAGRPIRAALVEAGRIRLLPITLTSLAAILGSLTIVSDPVWEGLAWAIIFGLTASTLLTLIIFPLLYFIFEQENWGER
jgi:multidrug efflux pump subunit AcrB